MRGSNAAIASMEFAIIAPVLLMLSFATVDGARALLIWGQVQNAANAVAQAAEKLSVTTDPTSGAITSELTADQIQTAMTAVYAEIPGLNLGNGGGLFPGPFSVHLASISYTPLCTAASGCAAQTPVVLWSSSLAVGGSQLISGALRPCSYTPQQVAHLPNNGYSRLDMPSPILAGGQTMTLAPQIVADVFYTFTPWFPLFGGSLLLYATATLPAPIGGLDATIALNTSGGSANVVACST